jgi:hypothetical protein
VQTVALGGNPLKRKTGMAGEEVDFGGGRLRGPRASTNNTVPRSVVAPCESQLGIWMPAGRLNIRRSSASKRLTFGA